MLFGLRCTLCLYISRGGLNCPEPADALFLRCEWSLDVVKPKRLGACGKPQRVRIIGHERRVARLRLSFHIVSTAIFRRRAYVASTCARVSGEWRKARA